MLTGCGGSSEDRGGGDGGSQAQPFSDAQAYKACKAHLSWEKECAALEPAPREEPYWGETECLKYPWRYMQQRVIDAMADCYASLSCESIDDVCADAGYAAIGIETTADMEAYLENDAIASRCGRIADQCRDLNGDMCFRFVIFTQEGRNASALCLDLECSQIESCLDDLE